MQKIIVLGLICTLTFSNCMFIGYFGKRPLYLVGAPDDIQVKHNGRKVDVTEESMANIVTSDNRTGFRERTKYWHPTALVKVRRNNKIELTTGGKTTLLNIKGKPGKGIVFMVLEAPITLGIGTIVDLATQSFYYPETKYIDVSAAFNNTVAKTKKELREEALKNARKEYITEVRR